MARSKAPRKSATVRSARPARVKRDGDTERRILDAARRVFVRRGSAGARMQEIAEEAQVNQALLHYYFRTKDALAFAVFREAAGRMFPAVFRILAGEGPLESRIEQLVHHYIDALRESPFIPAYVLAEINFDQSRIPALAIDLATTGRPAARIEMLARVNAELAERAAAGLIRPMTAEQFLVSVMSLCVFPFAARPMIAHMFGVEGAAWDAFLAERRRQLPTFILHALRP